MSARLSFFLPFFSRLLALVLALTVLAPGFGWEVAGYASAGTVHAVPDGAGADHHHASSAHDAAHGADCVTPDECGGNHPHCCPGHVLGHLPGHLASALRLPLLTGAQALTLENGIAFRSRVPQGLERPPRFYAA